MSPACLRKRSPPPIEVKDIFARLYKMNTKVFVNLLTNTFLHAILKSYIRITIKYAQK